MNLNKLIREVHRYKTQYPEHRKAIVDIYIDALKSVNEGMRVYDECMVALHRIRELVKDQPEKN